MQAKKLIEVAMPIKEISAESVRDKSIRHGHISTLHLWWARRPLPVCRAVVFASLVYDPEDANCPNAFKETVNLLLGRQENNLDPYKPYDDIPFTSVIDRMEDNLRNRLMMFIGKFSDKYMLANKQGKSVGANEMLSDTSLIKWDNKNDNKIIEIARKLIWVSHNANSGKSSDELITEFALSYNKIINAEQELYNLPNRHLKNEDVKSCEIKLQKAIDEFQDRMPKVFDPFAGGGAIPLEAARLGCRTYGNDINPVAHIIQKGSLEYPQKFGKPIYYSNSEFVKIYDEETFNNIPNDWKRFNDGSAEGVYIQNRLSFEVNYYGKKLLAKTEKEIGQLYPSDDKGNKPVAYYWARIGTCNNPSCKAEVPLLRGFSLCNKKDRKFFMEPKIEGNRITFEIVKRTVTRDSFNHRGNLKCPCCGSITDVNTIKQQNPTGDFKLKLLAIISESSNGKTYRIPSITEEQFITSKIEIKNFPSEQMQKNSAGGDLLSWGITKWGQVFSSRQLFVLNTLTENINKLKLDLDLNDSYYKSIVTYLGIFVDRIAAMSTSFGLWKDNLEAVVTPFSRQAIPIVFDFPEVNVFSNSTGSASNQLEWIIRYIDSESFNPFCTTLKNASSGEKNQFDEKYITAAVTDPPYYDAIAYADISDFFYIWLKRTLYDLFPLNFATPQTPKTEECTALKHHHDGSIQKAKSHFEDKLLQIFDAIEYQTSDIVSIMFAHQSTEAWTTLCNSILGAKMNITGSWAIDSERAVRGVALAGAALSSSVTVSCKPSQRQGYGEYRIVKKAIESKVAKEVDELYRLGFRGADLLTACFGQAVSEFGRYEKVEKADGSDVKVSELLEMARESAFNALLKGFDGDDFTKFYIGWLQLYGFTENEHNAALRIVQIGLSISIQDLYREHILILNQSHSTLANSIERNNLSRQLGEKDSSFLIDRVHKAMQLFKGPSRTTLLEFISKYANIPESSFWRVVTSLCEVLPNDSDDYIQAVGLLTNKESLIKESANLNQKINHQGQLEF